MDDELELPYFAEVVNTQSDYFGEEVYLTEKAKLGNEVWYKAMLDYEVSNKIPNLKVWFKRGELESIEY